jgi:hypothetical protein
MFNLIILIRAYAVVAGDVLFRFGKYLRDAVGFGSVLAQSFLPERFQLFVLDVVDERVQFNKPEILLQNFFLP